MAGWSKNAATEVQLPSGQMARLRRPGMQAFLKRGAIPDSLAPIIQAQLAKAQGKRVKDTADNKLDTAALMSDPAKIEAVMTLMDTVLLDVVVEPKMAAAPDNPEDRRDDVFYPDEVDLDDKVFIFNYAVGGTRDLERFRSDTAGAMAGVENEPVVSVPAE